uniref:Polyprotein n=1 Tax=Peronospora matthiolae TaxID=2874970 RepID=A0AAV1TQ25_9STRA
MKPAVEETAQPVLMSYSDADYAADKADRKVLTGSAIKLNGIIISWYSKKQGGVALSTMESEFVAASEARRELLEVIETLSVIGESPALPMKMLIDNQAAIRQIEGEASSTKAKHIDVRVKHLCDYARRGIVVPQYVPSNLMLADVLTKALNAVKTVKLRSLLHIV